MKHQNFITVALAFLIQIIFLIYWLFIGVQQEFADLEDLKLHVDHRAEILTQSREDTPPAADPQLAVTNKLSAVEASKFLKPDSIQTTPTADVSPQATAQAQPTLNRVKELHNSGFLLSMDGSYYALPDFEISWAQSDYYDFLLTEHTSANFIIQASASWESASQNAHLWNSGCGFVFRMNARGDHYLIFPALDGNVYLFRKIDYQIVKLESRPYSDLPVKEGQVEITLIAEGESITLLVDDAKVIQFRDGALSTGFLGYAVVSGTNTEFGTRCRMTNIALWGLTASN